MSPMTTLSIVMATRQVCVYKLHGVKTTAITVVVVAAAAADDDDDENDILVC